MPEQPKSSGKPMELVGVRTGASLKSPPPSTRADARAARQQQVEGSGEGRPAHMPGARKEAGTGGGDRGWWGQNLEKGEGPREGHKTWGDSPGLLGRA